MHPVAVRAAHARTAARRRHVGLIKGLSLLRPGPPADPVRNAIKAIAIKIAPATTFDYRVDLARRGARLIATQADVRSASTMPPGIGQRPPMHGAVTTFFGGRDQ